MPYAIRAIANGFALRQTRVMPASAAVLAMQWIDQGYTDVRIVVDGTAYSLDAFRARLRRVKGRWQQQGKTATASSTAGKLAQA